MEKEKETEKKDVKVQDLAPKKDAKGGAARSLDGGGSLSGSKSLDGGGSLSGSKSLDGGGSLSGGGSAN